MAELDQVKARIEAEVEKLQEQIISSVQELVRIDTVLPKEGQGQAYMASLYRELGLELDVFEADREDIAQHPAYVETPWGYQGRPNVVGTLRGEEGARSLILNGHVDVVSPEPLDTWQRDPFGGEIIDGRLYGRGANDMKAGLLANYWALRAVLQAGVRPKGTVQLQSVVEEEAGGAGGTLACFLRGHRADGMVITEPAPSVVVAMAGVTYFRVKVTGKTAHAGLAHLGVNAISKLYRIYDALVAWDTERASAIRYPLFEQVVGRSCHIVPGRLTAGDWPSTVAGSAVLECRMSFIPGEDRQAIYRQVRERVTAAAAGDPWLEENPPEVEFFGWQADPWEQDPADPLVRTFQANASRVWGRPVDLAGKAAGLDTRFAQYWQMPALTFGTVGGNHHGPDEWVDVESIITLAKTVGTFVAEWCGWRE